MVAFSRRFILLASLLCSFTVTAQNTSEEDYQAKLKVLKSTIAEIKAELSEVKGSRNELHRELEQSEVDIGALTTKIDTLQKGLSEQKKQLMQLNQKRHELQQAKKEQQQQISQQINAAYRLGQQGQIKLLLNQQNPDELARTLKYYELFSNARTEKINSYIRVLDELNSLEPKITAKTNQLESSNRQLQARVDELQSKQAKRKQTLAMLNKSIANKDQQLHKMDRDQKRLQRLLDTVVSAIANLSLSDDGQPFAKRKGKMTYPAKGAIVNRFGAPRINDRLRWDGLLIKASVGSHVSAIHHGRVVFSDYLRGHGLLMIVDHGDGYMSLYAHNQALLKDNGDWVSSGEVIARVGDSGGQNQGGLYFEIRHQGQPTNPSIWCRKA